MVIEYTVLGTIHRFESTDDNAIDAKIEDLNSRRIPYCIPFSMSAEYEVLANVSTSIGFANDY
jgi:hypothetical protein